MMLAVSVTTFLDQVRMLLEGGAKSVHLVGVGSTMAFHLRERGKEIEVHGRNRENISVDKWEFALSLFGAATALVRRLEGVNDAAVEDLRDALQEFGRLLGASDGRAGD